MTLPAGDIQQGRPFKVSINNTTMQEDPNGGDVIYNGDPNYGNYSYWLLNESRVLQFVRVERQLPGYMTICEIMVFTMGKPFFLKKKKFLYSASL